MKSKRFALFLFLFFVSGFSPVSAAWLDDVLATTPDNSWREVPLKMVDACPHVTDPSLGYTSCNISAWGGCAVNVVSGEVACTGGGHSDGAANHVGVADLINGDVYVGAKASPSSAVCFDCDAYADGKPTSDHLYEKGVFNPVAGAFYRLGTSSANGSGQYANFIIWKNPLSPNDQWTNEGTFTNGYYNVIGSSSGVDGDGMMYVTTTDNAGYPTLFKINPFTKQYTSLGEIPGGNGYTGTAVATGKSGTGKNYFAIAYSGSSKAIDLNNPVAGWKTYSVGGGANSPGVARINEKEILLFGGGTTLTLLNLETGASQSYQTSVMAGNTIHSFQYGIYGQFDCFPYANTVVCAYVSKVNDNIHILKATAMASKFTPQFSSEPQCENGATLSCGINRGACREGTKTCANDVWGPCVGAVGPGSEACNNVDDDCDGSIDEGITRACYTGPSGTQGVGACKAGTETCSAGSFGTCQGQVLPSTEACNDNTDNDCDGQTDEGCSGGKVCKLDVNGDGNINVLDVVALIRPLLKVEPYSAAKDVNDDGAINILDVVKVATSINQPLNEVCPDTTTCTPNQSSSCPTGQPGACATGSQVCNASGTGYGACTPNQSPTTETCNNVDDDCDGSIDEGNVCAACTPGAKQSCYTGPTGTQGIGTCKAGERTCLSTGQWSECSGQVTPATDTCGDGLDQDCDGRDRECSDAPNVENSITVTNASTQAISQPIVSFARPSRKGEFFTAYQATVNGQPVETQTNVRNTWPDGSIRNAVVTVALPSMTAGETVTVKFKDGQGVGNNGFLSKDDILNSGFDASIKLSGAATHEVSARTMVANDDFEYWLKGPLVTGIRAGDRGRKYDKNTDNGNGNPLHPTLYAQLYRNGQVKLVYSIENTWISSVAANSMRDQTYALDLKYKGATKWSHPTFTHRGKTLVTKEFWGTTGQEKLQINHNPAYLATTGQILPYDVKIPVDPKTIQDAYTGWLNASKTLGGNTYGIYGGPLGTAGAADFHDIGKLTTFALKTSDPRMLQAANENLEISGMLQAFYREADTGRPYDGSGSVDAGGFPPSYYARPTNGIGQINYGAKPEDVINLGSVSSDGVGFKTSHMPVLGLEAFINENPVFLEMALMEAHTVIFAGPGDYPWGGRGNLALGYPGATVPIQLGHADGRGEARPLVSVLTASQLALDGSPEQAYLREAVEKYLVALHCKNDQPNPYSPKYEDTCDYAKIFFGEGSDNLGRTGGQLPPGPFKPLRRHGGNYEFTPVIGKKRVADATWGWSLLTQSYGMSKFYGFESDALLQDAANFYFSQLWSSKPLQVGSYVTPTIKYTGGNPPGEWYRTIEEVNAAFEPGEIVSQQPSGGIHSYFDMAGGATKWLPTFSAAGHTGLEAAQRHDSLVDRVGTESNPGNLRKEGAKWALDPKIVAAIYESWE